MARINRKDKYPLDNRVTLNDDVLGNDFEKGGKTKTFSVKSLVDLVNESNGLKASTYKFSDESEPTIDHTDEGYFTIQEEDDQIVSLKINNVNQEGDLMQASNRGAGAYSGATSGPNYDAAFTTASDMASPVAVGTAGIDGKKSYRRVRNFGILNIFCEPLFFWNSFFRKVTLSRQLWSLRAGTGACCEYNDKYQF